MRYLFASTPVAVLNLVRSVYQRAQTGTLEFETEDGPKRLYFVDGQLYLCQSVSPLAQKIDDHLKSSAPSDSSRPGGVMGQLLRMTAEHLASWKVRSYRFTEGFRVDARELVGPLPTAAIVGEPIASSADDYTTFLNMVGGPTATLVATDLATAKLKDSVLSHAEMDVLFRLVRPTRLEELLPMDAASSKETLAILSRLWALDLVHRASEAAPEAPAPVPRDRPRESAVEDRVVLPESQTDEAESTQEAHVEETTAPVREDLSVREPTAQIVDDDYPRTSAADSPPSRKVTLEETRYEKPDLGDWYHHFYLSCEPFSLTPDPAFLFLTDNHSEALAGMTLSLLERRGLCVMTGEVGTGKTTLLYGLLSSLESDVETAYVHNPALLFDQLLESVLTDLGVSIHSCRRVDMLSALNEFLLSCAHRGKTVALVVDEAQNLSDSTFEALRLLLNFETFDTKLLQIILVGQPELGERLRSDRLRQIANRIAIRCQLDPLSQSESQKYVRHRLEAARGESEVFTRGALNLVAKKGRGIPRRINVICHNALLFAFAQGKPKVTRALVSEAIRDIEK